MNERRRDDVSHGYSDIDGGDVPQTQVHDEAQEDEEVYRVNLDDDAHPSNEFSRDTFRVPVGRGEQRSRQNSNDKVCNNFAQVVLTKKITMNSKRQKRYSLSWSFQRTPDFIGHASIHLKS
ncbi:hypothetical protein V5N11_018726 [Cardamine amara subsp. amara]|uniref:Uncharacterized protein n=1 Tax=Cardamine amara subsp. amara TaxID=228776 RepID=A0ABD1AZI9_CARAN